MLRRVKIILLFCFTVLNLSLSASKTVSLLDVENLDPLPIQVGEVLTYKVKIAGLSAGTQLTSVLGKTTINDELVYHLTSESQTDSVFAKLYHFRDVKESFVTADRLYPVQFTKNLEDRNDRFNVNVQFDCKTQSAQYSKNKQSKVIEVPVGTQDELSMVYLLRSKPLRVGQTYTFPVLVKDRAQDVTFEIYRREIRKTKALGRVETLAIRTSHDYLIWLTNDIRRIPVRIEAKTQVGKLIGTLEKVDVAHK